MKNAPRQIKVEAIRGTEELEMIFDRQSGALLKREVNRADARDIGRVRVEFDTRDRNFFGADGNRNSLSGFSLDDDDDSRSRSGNSGSGSQNSGSGSGKNDDD